MVHTGVVEINTTCSDVAFQSCSSELYVDNEFMGYTPLLIFLPVGKREYNIIKPEYTSIPGNSPFLMTGTIVVNEKLKESLDVELINMSMTGGISIHSSPEGAKIYIDGKEQEATTQTVITGISPGDHKYKLSIPGYKDFESSFTALLGEPLHIHDVLTQSNEFGTLYINATPILYGTNIPYILKGAYIYIDGIYSGKNVPLPITGISKGVHTFILKRYGIEDIEGMFIINGGDTLIIDVYPILQPNIGMLAIHTTPYIGNIKIANVYIDGKSTGEHTDDRYALKEGTHTYRLHVDGFEDPQGTFDIVTNRITRITPHICHIGTPRRGMVTITSNPSGALVTIDEINLGQYTPTSVKHLKDGEYTYKLSKPGYFDTTGTFTIENENVIDLNPSLTQKDTILDISCNVIAAMIYIDDHTEEMTTPAEIIGITPGTHTYRLVIPPTYGGGTFSDAIGTFKIEKGKTTKIDAIINLEKDKTLGNINVQSIPPGAKVFIDDIDTGKISPNDIIGVSSGIHKIKLILSGYEDWIGNVNVIRGAIVSISNNLIPKKS